MNDINKKHHINMNMKCIIYGILLIMFININGVIKAVNSSYGYYPDHKGASEIIKKVYKNDDIVIALDVLQQHNYGVDVDYWLRCQQDANKFTRNVNGEFVDIYTGTKLIGSGKKLKQVIDTNKDKNIFFITTGERYYDHSYFMKNGIYEIYMDYLKFADILYKGKDGKTLVWRLC